MYHKNQQRSIKLYVNNRRIDAIVGSVFCKMQVYLIKKTNYHEKIHFSWMCNSTNNKRHSKMHAEFVVSPHIAALHFFHGKLHRRSQFISLYFFLSKTLFAICFPLLIAKFRCHSKHIQHSEFCTSGFQKKSANYEGFCVTDLGYRKHTEKTIFREWKKKPKT